ncbi:MAG TPA: hypothetical protein VER11_05325, partial [Polyangiaceae bacterium]|nr:hypothetical protein [Polyangiaceae bacterium]
MKGLISPSTGRDLCGVAGDCASGHTLCLVVRAVWAMYAGGMMMRDLGVKQWVGVGAVLALLGCSGGS